MTTPTYDVAAAISRASDKNKWGDAALPPMTLGQATILIDALNDAYATGYMRGQKHERDKKLIELADRREES